MIFRPTFVMRRLFSSGDSCRSAMIRSRAFTLLEVLCASAILSLIVAALAQAVVAGQMQSRDAMYRARATTVAKAILAEVNALPYHDPDGASEPGPESDEQGRSDFDNIDDYDGFVMEPGQLTDAVGVSFPEADQDFQCRVSVGYDSLDARGLGAPQPGVRIEVTVRADERRWHLTRFVAEPIQ